MKKYKWLIILSIIVIALVIVAISFSDKESDYIKETNIQNIIKMQEKDKTFILYIKQTNCEHCKVFTPRFLSVLKKHNLKAYALNLTDLSEKDKKKYDNMFEIEGTPTVLFYNEGEENKLIRIEGEVTKDKIESKLKSAGFIK